MLIITILGITTAISLNYFNTFAVTEFWKRILVIAVSLIAYMLLMNNNLTYCSSTTAALISYTESISLGLLEYLFLLLLFSSVIGIISIKGLDSTQYLFILTLTLGSVLLITSTDFISIFIGLELQSYSVYLLAASSKNHEPSENAGLKYFLLGALSSTFILMGIVLLYTVSGSTNFNYNLFMVQDSSSYVSILGLLLILIGILWKIAAAPLHAWSIDVYDAVPGKITAILSLLPKIGLFYFAVKLLAALHLILNKSTLLTTSLANIITVVIILSFAIGSILGLRQSRIKRLLAYSSILNVGFILIAALLFLDLSTTVVYVVQYIITTVAIWYCLTNNFNLELTLNSQLQGLGSTSKVLAICLTLLILSTAGIPPMVGFFAKLQVILLSVQAEYFTLAVAAIIASLISTVYYLNLISCMWFRSKEVSINSISSLVKGDSVISVTNNYFISIIITLIITVYVLEQNLVNTVLSFVII